MCNIEFTIGGSTFVLENIDPSIIPSEVNEKLAEIILRFPDKWKEILDKLNLFLRLRTQVDSQDTELYKRAIANTTAEYLHELYPEIPFPTIINNAGETVPAIDLSKVKVLFIKSFKGRTNLTRVLSPDGRTEIFLVDNREKNIKKLADYLTIKYLLDNEILNKLEEEELKLVDEVLTVVLNKILSNKEFGKLFNGVITDRKSLLLQYITNKSKFKNINLNGESIGRILENFLPDIKGIFYKRKNDWKNREVSKLYDLSKYKKKELLITKSSLFSLFNSPLFKTSEEFDIAMSKSEKSDEVIKYLKIKLGLDFTEDPRSGYEIFFDELLKREPGFPYEFERSDGSKIHLKSTFYELKKTYDIGFDTILEMDREPYKGWSIYSNPLGFFITLFVELTEETRVRRYDSLEDAKKAIDELKAKETFSKDYLREVFLTGGLSMLVNLPKYLTPGTVICLNVPKEKIPTNPSFLNHPKENIIFSAYTKEKFIELIKEWKAESLLLNPDGTLISTFNSINNIGNFIILLQKELTRDLETLTKILHTIKEGNLTYYYVDSVSKEMRGYKTRLLRVPNPNKIDVNTKKKNRANYSLISFWTTLGEKFQKLFGINLQIMTQNELASKFNGDESNQKAFIKNNTIYINSTLASTNDLFHEYSHILLGYLKIHNREAYEQLLLAVWDKTNWKEQENIENLYKGYDYIARLEENFVRQFGKYAVNTSSADLSTFFERNITLKETVETIFDVGTLDAESLSRKKMGEVFYLFSSEISKALRNNHTRFLEFMNTDEFALSNKKTNLLKKWIEEGILKETNCK